MDVGRLLRPQFTPGFVTSEDRVQRRLYQRRVARARGIEAYTLCAAIPGRGEKEEGTLEAGRPADRIVVSQNLLEIDPMQIGKTEVLLTMVGGKIVYESPNWKAAGAGCAKEMGQ